MGPNNNLCMKNRNMKIQKISTASTTSTKSSTISTTTSINSTSKEKETATLIPLGELCDENDSKCDSKLICTNSYDNKNFRCLAKYGVYCTDHSQCAFNVSCVNNVCLD